MCVAIFVGSESRRPNEDQVSAMWEVNPDGAGIAWREREGLVKWKKGLDLNQIQDLIKRIKPPYVAHFRVASVGPAISKLTHPFPITEDVSLDLEGSGDYPVLFHNGTWHSWKHETFSRAGSMGYRIPDGKWSDTRALALLAHHYGIGALEMVDEKLAVVRPRGTVVSFFGNWITHEGSFMTTNDGWMRAMKKKGSILQIADRRHSASQQQQLQSGTPAKEEHPATQTPTTPVITGAASTPTEVPTERTTPALVEGGGPSVVVPFRVGDDIKPFVQPLSFYEKRHTDGLITQKGIGKIRKYFERLERGSVNTFPPKDLLTHTPRVTH